MAAPKRTKIQREYDLKTISQMYLKGHIQAKIADHINANRDYEVTRQTITRDIKTIQKRWLASSLVDFNEAKAESLAKIDNLEEIYWIQFLASEDPIVKRKTAKKIDGQTTEATQEISLGAGDPRFLQGVQWCIDRRIKLLGLDAPVKREVSGPDGAPIKVANVNFSDLTDEQLQRIAAGEAVVDIIGK